MHGVIAWCGFFGAWLLFAGPVYQAALELHEQDIEEEQLAAAREGVRIRPISPWWWLLPPVRYWLGRRRAREYREAMLRALADEHLNSLVRFLDKANGWLLVALGGLLIAAKETGELVEYHHWPTVLFWVLLVVMAALCALYTVARMRRSHDILTTRDQRQP
ncbi:hypothetical protein V5P93_001461 [Actinokineospora auranticolor]|uniref:Uncharacterized protein n=1 Tax=Actinokineospora auranticolor TaxID=155976 RepID=A0A2S6GV13_9PSEU|nr:hypothetical protein [Actinokineospora auranticolor]PPK69085.1 hypothetical protein CLV40_104336 [Actinokineospora auranticolor]